MAGEKGNSLSQLYLAAPSFRLYLHHYKESYFRLWVWHKTLTMFSNYPEIVI